MKHRSPLGVFFLSLFTLGIYALVWHVKTKGELVSRGADIPTSWLLIVPFANLYWIWKYSEGVEKVSNGKISTVMTLLMLLVLSIVGMAILQSMYNGLDINQPNQPAGPLPSTGQPADVAAAPNQIPPMPPTQSPTV